MGDSPALGLLQILDAELILRFIWTQHLILGRNYDKRNHIRESGVGAKLTTFCINRIMVLSLKLMD